MLNLLVAIVCDTYCTVIDNLKIRDPYLANKIIIEMETYMFWNRKKGTEGHLIFAEYDEVQDASIWRKSFDENDDLNSKFKQVEEKLMSKMDDHTNKIGEQIEKELASFVDKLA